jgi:membrane associated rhomboid family serine protease|tara:strand:- start:127 stop:834 length:708 start_codon:yes stop_codon:yes gene_type:complete
MNFLLSILLVSFGLAYLFVVSLMAFKQRSNVIWLVFINIGIFIYSYYFNPQLIARYALSGAKLVAGHSYTLISYMFFHANPLHLFINTFGLLFFGYNMEKQMGMAQFLMVYFVSGLVAGGFFALLAPSQLPVVGASGAIFGIMAYYTLIRPFMISPMPFIIPLPVSLASFLYVVSVIPIMASGDFSGTVAHVAHIGGMLGGGLMAFGMNYVQALKGAIVVLFIAVLTYILPLLLR